MINIIIQLLSLLTTPISIIQLLFICWVGITIYKTPDIRENLYNALIRTLGVMGQDTVNVFKAMGVWTYTKLSNAAVASKDYCAGKLGDARTSIAQTCEGAAVSSRAFANNTYIVFCNLPSTIVNNFSSSAPHSHSE